MDNQQPKVTKKKKWLWPVIIVSVIVLLLIFLVVAIFATAGIVSYTKDKNLQEQLDLGERYLDELDYEAAIVAYEMAIEIDSKSVDAYIGLADVYVEMKKYEDAIDVLKDGYNETEEEELLDAIEKIEEIMEDAESLDGEEVECNDESEQPENGEESSFVPGSVEVSVEDAYTYSGVDALNGGMTYCYHIPRLLLNGNANISANDYIYNELYTYINEQSSLSDNTMCYVVGNNDSICSALVQVDETLYWYPEYYVYNISLESGEIISHSEVIASYGYTEETFNQALKTALETKLSERRSEYMDDETYNSCVENTLADSNLQQAVPYIDASGDLCVVIKMDYYAGAGMYYTLVNISGNAEPTEPACAGNHD